MQTPFMLLQTHIIYSSQQHICLLKKSAAFAPAAGSRPFLVVKQKSSSKVVKLEEFKKNKQAVKSAPKAGVYLWQIRTFPEKVVLGMAELCHICHDKQAN